MANSMDLGVACHSSLLGNLTYYNSPLGKVGIVQVQHSITHIFFQNDEVSFDSSSLDTIAFGAGKKISLIIEETPLLEMAKEQLSQYFARTRKVFDLPLSPMGTAFMCKDWQALQSIPYGETRSYKEIATELGNPKACRAVGMANNRNPISIVIPCHRVIGANGDLVGYAGGLHLKTYLLELERNNK